MKRDEAGEQGVSVVDGETPTPELLITARSVVYPWQCDHMGHMNVMWYTGKFDEATWQLMGEIGITPSYLRDNKRGVAAVEQHTSYKHEVFAGELITIRSGILEVREKVIRFYHEMLKAETGEIVASTTLTGVHLNTEVRKSCPFPTEVIERAGRLVVRSK